MPRFLPFGAIIVGFLGSSLGLFGQTPESRLPESRLEDALKEIALLKRALADQNLRIASLERTVKPLQSAALSAARRVSTVPWKTPEAWAEIKVGMSRAQVVEILGEPKSTDSVMDRQTLFYKDDAELIGSVIITDDRVAELAAPKFQVYIPLKK